MERWNPIPEFAETHEVSDRGRVRRYAPWSPLEGIRRGGTLITPQYHLHYPTVQLIAGGKQRTFNLPALVLDAFGPPRPSPKCRVGFRDGDTTNCALDNLFWIVPKKVKQQLRSAQRRQHKKTRDALIHALHARGWSYRQIAEVADCDQSLVGMVLQGRR